MSSNEEGQVQGYQQFLEGKRTRVQSVGFKVSLDEINPMLFGWQKEIVQWAARLGKAALFEECGLGKTCQFLAWADLVVKHAGGKVLVLSPLAVAYQTVKEGQKFGIAVRYVRSQEAADQASEMVLVTNYDMLDRFDASTFVGVILDESSVLKAYTGATKRMILDMFERTSYKLACTATPAPNDHLELGNHGEFLNIMPSNEMIMRWFINDTMQAGAYRLKKRAAADFWRWVTSWAVCIGKPGDLGYSDDGFILPPLRLHASVVEVDHTRAFESGYLFLIENSSATTMWREKRATAEDRCHAAREIVGDSKEPWIIWVDTNYEADIAMRLFPDAVEVRGSDSFVEKERKLNAFGDGEVAQLITKPEIGGFGLNYQHCSKQVFVGLTYSFEVVYQALRRSWRYGQANPVDAYLIYAESEGNIMKTLVEKQEAHRTMQDNMNAAMAEHGLGLRTGYRAIVPAGDAVTQHDGWTMYLGDCVEQSKKLADDRIDYTVFSPPFSSLYIYSDSMADMGNSADDEEFFRHFGYLIKELYRVTVPGRLCSVHCKDLPLYMNRDGAAGLRDFPGHVIRAFEEAGWVYHSRVTIWKDPVIEMQRTKNHGLLYKNFRVRGEVCRMGMADFVVTFRKWAEDKVSMKPVIHDREDWPLEIWQRYASPVWFDIQQTNVLNTELAREARDEKHIAPLQLDVIERCIDLWTNPGDLVLDPFAGLGSTGVVAIQKKRRFVGIELKESYAAQAVKFLEAAEAASKTLLDLPGVWDEGVQP